MCEKQYLKKCSGHIFFNEMDLWEINIFAIMKDIF